MRRVLATERLFTPGYAGPGRVVVEDGLVTDVLGPGPADVECPVLAPGLVDLQCNGAGDTSFATGGRRNWARARLLLAGTGAATVLPTIVTGSSLGDALDGFDPGGVPEFAGLHLEGPMLSPARHGAHPAGELAPLDVDAIAALPVRLVTLAPEVPGALEVAADLMAAGIAVAAGHTDADADEAQVAFDAGVHLVTHLWNAMAPLGHRAPGLVGAALVDERVRVCVIGDGVHVDPRVVLATWRAVGPDRFVAVTDSVGVTEELATLGVHVDGAGVRDRDGALVGSAASIGAVLRNLVLWGLPVTDALAAVTSNPAAAVGLDDRGRIEVGLRADLTALDDDLHVIDVGT